MQESLLFSGPCSAQPSLFRRLVDELTEATRQFRENPKAYLASAIKNETPGAHSRKSRFRLGLAVGILLYAVSFGAILVLWEVSARRAVVTDKDQGFVVIHLPSYQPQDSLMKKSDKDGGGGGGGGREIDLPPSIGVPPPFSPEAPIMAPTTRPTPHPPSLPVIERLLGDPSQNIRREDLPTGIPDGVPGPPSDGSGTNGGIGTGNNGGVGRDEGPGFGPGRNGGEGGDDYRLSGRRGRPEAVNSVDVKPVALNAPRPNYTEEARKNKIQGVVRASVLVGIDGLVKQVRIIRGLPNGLNEEAIRAAMQMRFSPAMRNGQAVAYWSLLDVEFNLR
jgi:periplasmic protein TonB